MARVLESANLDHLIQRCKAGETLKHIAKSIGVCDRTLMDAFHRVGFRHREHAREQRAAAVPGLYAAHVAGESILAISKRTGVSRKALVDWFAEHGLRQRGHHEAQRQRHTISTAAERKALTAGANAAARGRLASADELARKAATRSRRVGMYERELIEELAARGIHAEGQHPVGPYNLDLWLHEPRVAVEIFSAHPGVRLMASIKKRTEYLLDAGISVLAVQVSYPRRVFDVRAVADKVISFADLCRRDQPAIGHHGVIRGYGQTAATSSHQLDGRPLVTGF